MPAGLVEHENGMCLRGQGAGDLVKMMLHRLRVGARHDYGCPRATLGADRTKEIGRFGAQIGECSRSGAAPRPAPCARFLLAEPRPAPCARVLLAEPHFVLKPDFYRRLGIERRRD